MCVSNITVFQPQVSTWWLIYYEGSVGAILAVVHLIKTIGVVPCDELKLIGGKRIDTKHGEISGIWFDFSGRGWRGSK